MGNKYQFDKADIGEMLVIVGEAHASNMPRVTIDTAYAHDVVGMAYESFDIRKQRDELKLMLAGVIAEYEELLDKSIDHVGSHGTSAMAQAKILLSELQK